MRSIVLVPLLAGLASSIHAPPAPAEAALVQDAQTSGPCPNPLPHELLIAYEVTGGTLVGPVDGMLTVYSDGLARYGSYLGPGPGFQYVASVSPQAASDLHAALLGAGALRQCDQPDLWNDVPLSTLTVLRGGTSSKGHSFSWWIAEGDVATIETLLQDFVAASFPAAPSGGTGF